ncbi:MAG TPA: hypothetical protein VF660_11025, partial [Actinomycetota bacterium]
LTRADCPPDLARIESSKKGDKPSLQWGENQRGGDQDGPIGREVSEGACRQWKEVDYREKDHPRR